MAYEIKALLILLAEHALSTDSKRMYEIIAKTANAEGIMLKPYSEAKAEQESDKEIE